MSEPQATIVQGGASVVGGLIVLAGPELGPWLAVLAASFVGSLWTLGASDTDDKGRALFLLARINLTACALTGCVAVPVVTYNLLPYEYALPMVRNGEPALAIEIPAKLRHYEAALSFADGGNPFNLHPDTNDEYRATMEVRAGDLSIRGTLRTWAASLGYEVGGA